MDCMSLFWTCQLVQTCVTACSCGEGVMGFFLQCFLNSFSNYLRDSKKYLAAAFKAGKLQLYNCVTILWLSHFFVCISTLP